MKGRRRPDFFSDRPRFRWNKTQPGDYWKLRDGHWSVIAPSGETGSVRPPIWTITEHEDGTITVAPSIFFNSPHGWHGFLEKGIWRLA